MPLPATNREQMQARSSGNDRVLIPKIPYVPPPSDPRQIPQWYDRYHRQMEDWREKTNQALTNAQTTAQAP